MGSDGDDNGKCERARRKCHRNHRPENFIQQEIKSVTLKRDFLDKIFPIEFPEITNI